MTPARERIRALAATIAASVGVDCAEDIDGEYLLRCLTAAGLDDRSAWQLVALRAAIAEELAAR